MSEAQVSETTAGSSKGRPAKKAAKAGLFARIALFVRQIIGELKKVVTPTRKELVRYTLVVLVFVAIMMVIVSILDIGFGTAVSWVFGGVGPSDR
ncbi:preprotein translocase subunit SecE [Pseudarthrobacter sp. PS3-L1]|uniref:preprotein translocase subunit SecE n=1 Tax=Pseudarthrobacter sp. PS3-L1 TaxID=3046207 RepID=UPI0024BADCB6|nr:preprotein translocase subunit SecE [Pseudarthrobacter sp. PS3-L1]MDJ0321263.1 preprotein translocase subunit SecE [Pseudarthrobacter sp. PS3-L1]